jgi:hypothetical protein
MPSITVDIPDGAGDFQARAAQAIAALAEAERARLLERSIISAVLEDDEYLAIWARLFLPNMPVTRAKSYREVAHNQEIHLGAGRVTWAHDEPHRPVIMRGSLAWLKAKYSNGGYHISVNGWIDKVFWRWVKMRRLYVFSHEDFTKATADFLKRCHEKHCPSYHFEQRLDRYVWGPSRQFSEGRVVVNGRLLILSNPQIKYIMGLRKIAAKTARLDERKAALLANQRERMNARRK